MWGTRGVLASALVLVLASCGLSVVGIGASGADGGASSGGPNGADAADDDDAPAAPDGGAGIVDAATPDDSGCTTLVNDDFTMPDPRWKRAKDAVFEGGAAVLVEPLELHQGAIFIPVPPEMAPATSFVATFKMLMVPPADAAPADGITVAWASDVGTPHFGGTGSDLGFCPNSNSDDTGPVGAAVGLRVLGSTGVYPRESDGGSCRQIPNNDPPYAFGSSQLVVVTVRSRRVEVRVGTKEHSFEIASAVPIRWIGFTASTGGAVARFLVDDVAIRICR